MFSDFVSLVYPRNCIHCHRPLISKEEFICTACKIDLPQTKDYLNLENELFQKFAWEPKVVSAFSFLYLYRDGIAQNLLYHLKYKGKKELGAVLGKWFANSLGSIEVDMIIPVPIHNRKLRKRGYNQSDFLAEGMGEILNVQVNKEILHRTVFTSSQTRKLKVDRWMNVNNVYSTASATVKGKRILVVDDVITTGATIGMVCKRLVEAECASITLASIARGK